MLDIMHKEQSPLVGIAGDGASGEGSRLGWRGLGPSWGIALASLVGIAAFGFPFLLPAVAGVGQPGSGAVRTAEAPVVLALLTGLALLGSMAAVSGRGGDDRAASGSKMVALLGALVAIDATLRLVPTFLGASPIFVLILLVGVAFGPSFGFLMGSLTLLVSAFLTGGLGPWLPYQMLGTGWVGLSAGWLPRWPGRPGLLLLAVFGGAWGFLYGALLNLYSWPFAAPGLDLPTGFYWTPGIGVGESLRRYAGFYLTTSLLHDLFRAIANAALLLALGGPILRLLARYRSRFVWQSTTWLE